MNVRLKYKIDFLAGLYYNGSLHSNAYEVSLNFVTNCYDREEQNTALDRIRFFMQSINSAVFIFQEDQETITKLKNIGARVISLPEDPIDQIIGMMLYTKLNAITEKRIIVTDVEIGSILGEYVIYQHSEEEPVGPFAQPGWWDTAEPMSYNNNDTDQYGNVVTLNNSSLWKDLGLDWTEQPVKIVSDDDKVVFADFNKDENN